MYTSLLLGAAALVLLSDPLIGWLTWLALAIVLFLKSTLEEQWMQDKHPGYTAYAKQNKRFLPWLF
jgi:protein-S-isoprenylcysteine O-methyltransferase Ste14